MRKISYLIFKALLRLAPSYLVSPFLNKVKNFFAKRCLESVTGTVNFGSNIRMSRDISVGDQSGVGNNAFLVGPITFGKYVMMGRDVTILRSDHKTDSIEIPMALQGMCKAERLVVEDDVWICDGVVILPKVRRIGKGAILGAHAVVTRDVPDYAVVVGNPGKIVKYRDGTPL